MRPSNAVSALALAVLACAVTFAAAAETRMVTLAETRPLETALGDPALSTAQAEWLDMVKGAKTSLDFEEFYLSEAPPSALTPVLDEIGKAAARGVHVRLLLDAGMHRTYPQPADSLGKLPNVTVRTVDYKRLAGGVQHSKFFVVDGAEAYLGSQNLDWRSLSHIHELGVRLRDPRLAATLLAVYETDWASADTTNHAAPALPAVPAFPIAFHQDGADGQLWMSASPDKRNPAGVPWDLDVIVQRINAAQKEVCAQTLNFNTGGYGVIDSTLYKALVAAAGRGVKVKFLVSDWVLGGRGEAELRALAKVPNLEVKIGRVPEWSGGYISFARVEHLKYMVVDGEWLWVGTANWEPSYFLTTRNVALTVHHAPLAAEGRKIFEADWTGPTALSFGPEAVIAPRGHGEKK